MDLRDLSPAPPSLLGRNFGQPLRLLSPTRSSSPGFMLVLLSLMFNHQLSCSHEPFPSEDVNLSDSGGRPFSLGLFSGLSSRLSCVLPSLTLSPDSQLPWPHSSLTPVFLFQSWEDF